MPRKPRFYLPVVPVNIVQRGNNRQSVYFDDEDRRAYLRFLADSARDCGCAIHAYVLMTNHVHLLATPSKKNAISRMMQHLGRNYVTYINHRHRRSGTLWEGRHKGCVISAEDYFLGCSRYIEMNPVRAGMVDRPGQYPWSSYRMNALGDFNPLLSPHRIYLELGGDRKERFDTYRALFSKDVLSSEDLRNIRESAQTGTPLGNSRFKKHVESILDCKTGQAKRGRLRVHQAETP